MSLQFPGFVYILILIGYVTNALQIIGSIEEPLTGLFIVKCVGLASGILGAALGYVGIFF